MDTDADNPVGIACLIVIRARAVIIIRSVFIQLEKYARASCFYAG